MTKFFKPKLYTMAKTKSITIPAPNFQVISFEIQGTAPLMQCRFPEKAKLSMMAKMASSTKAKRTTKEARDFDRDFEQAKHVSVDGWYGIPAAAFRSAAIRACKIVGFNMTDAKMSVFVEADGYGVDGTPLVKMIAGEPERSEMMVRIQQTTDVRIRPLWKEWGAILVVRFDADQFKVDDVLNLFWRAGIQVGVGEGRPFSKSSDGMGFGTFKVIPESIKIIEA